MIASLLILAAIFLILLFLWRRPTRLDWQAIDVNGVERRYLLRITDRRARDRALLLCFHGGRAQVELLARRAGIAEAGERQGCLVVFPEARDGWIDLRPERGGGTRDIDFVDALVDRLVSSNQVDPCRVFALGISNGGQFVFRLGCERPDRFAGLATALSNLPVAALSWQSAPAVPIALIFGRHDRIMPWEGGRLRRGPGLRAGGEVLSAPDTVRFWVERNGAARQPQQRQIFSAGRRIEIDDYASGQGGGAPVRSVTIGNWGHRWPRWEAATSARADRFNAVDLVMEFFAGRSLSARSAPLCQAPRIVPEGPDVDP